MSLSYKRSVRVGELIQQTVSEVIREIKDLNSGLVTIMGVKLTDDLLSCKIHYSIFGSAEDKQKADEVLKRNTGKVRHQLALRLNLRRTPIISFVYDGTNERATKIFDILKNIEEEK
ncbi:MAG: 30S ribosome-binding factor RbfA [Endomicrobium sp.]|uniref:30S ribosome-binding factor RbfA n=1 Tax=Candidatus Endomicrobiellum pyrsonymphae TaxID=1408203 RepID=UPI00358643DB|nr:30S ribosome-binding factor RbfA [Endomicrobium sp.]